MVMTRRTHTRSGGVPRPAIAAAIAVAVIAVSVLIAISARGGSTTSGEVTGVGDVRAVFAGVPQQGDRLGEADAPVEIVEFADLQCPFCAQAATDVVPQLIDRYVKTGQAKLTFKPLTFIGPDSERGAQALAAAGAQGQMWAYAELLYRNQGTENGGWLSDEYARKAAEALALDLSRFDADRTGDDARRMIIQARADADAAGVTGTPTFVVRGAKGSVTIRDFTKADEFDAAVRSVRSPT